MNQLADFAIIDWFGRWGTFVFNENTAIFYIQFRGRQNIISTISGTKFVVLCAAKIFKSKKISNDQEPIQSDPTSCPQNQKGNS